MKPPALTEKQLINQILRRNEAAKSIRRQKWEWLWNEVMQFLWPQMGSMLAGTAFQPGEKRGQRCYDGTPEDALDIFVAGMQSGTIPEQYPWIEWELIPKWANTRNVKIWLQMCRDITLEFLAASNFAMATNLTYRHLAAFGTACKLRLTSSQPGKPFSFNCLRLTDVVFFEGKSGIVDSMMWEFKISARNAVMRWGDDAPGACKKATESGNHEAEFQFLQAIFPREDYNSELKDNKNMPFANLVINPAKREIVEESGFKTFPASVPRWDKLDDSAFSGGAQLGGGVYGRGPGIKSYQDMELLNRQARTNLIGGEKMGNPAIFIPSDGYERKIKRYPGAENYYDPSIAAKIYTADDLRGLPFSREMQMDQRAMIKERFHVDLFLPLINLPPGMTATEATIRNQHALVINEPMISRQRVEHLELDIDWAFSVLYEAGEFPPPPDEVFKFGQGIKNIFKSPLFMAQEGLKATKVLTAYQKAGAIVQARGGNQDVLDNFDDDKALAVMMEADNVPAEIIRDPKDRDQIRKARVDERKKMVMEQQLAMAAKAAGQMGKVKTGDGGGDNMANDMAKAATGEGD